MKKLLTFILIMVGTISIMAQTIINPNFTNPVFNASVSWQYLSNDGLGNGWYFIPTGGDGGGGIGTNGCPWFVTSPVGNQAAFIQKNCTLVQSNIVFSSSGIVWISFYAQARAVGFPSIQIGDNVTMTIDGKPVGYWDATN